MEINEMSMLVSKINDLSKKYDCKAVLDKTVTIENDIRNFKIKIVFVGGFSAGKSALINTYLNQDLLEEDIRPETAIATELEYGKIEKDVYLDKSGYQLNKEDNDLNKRYKLKKYIPNERLLSLSDYILVDMPGFDSGIEKHNKAILQYIAEASVYVLVVDVTKGTLSRSCMNFINEIKNYSEEVCLILTKTDKVSDDIISEVFENISVIINNSLGKEVPCIITSKYDDDFNLKLNEVMRKFPYESVVNNKFIPQISSAISILLNIIKSSYDNIELNTYDIENKILKCKREKENLEKELDKEKNNLHTRISLYAKDNIVSELKSTLLVNERRLFSAATAGSEMFSQEINSIIRPVLIKALEKNIEMSFKELVERMNEVSIKMEYSDEMAKTIKVAFDNLQKLGAKAGEHKGLYKGILTTIAVVTDVVAPWMELIIIFLPEILSFIGSLFGDSAEEKFHNKFVNQIIPSIIAKIEPSISESLENLKEQLLDELQNNFNVLFEEKINSMQKLVEEKNNKIIAVNSRKEELLKDMEILKSFEKRLIV